MVCCPMMFITNGGSGFDFCYVALCDQGRRDHGIPNRFYANYAAFAREFGAKSTFMQTNIWRLPAICWRCCYPKRRSRPEQSCLLTNPVIYRCCCFSLENGYGFSNHPQIEPGWSLTGYTSIVWRLPAFWHNAPSLPTTWSSLIRFHKRYQYRRARVAAPISKQNLPSRLSNAAEGPSLCSPIMEQFQHPATAILTTPVSYLESEDQEYKNAAATRSFAS